MATSTQVLKRIFNAFDPFRPLPAGARAYVDCREVRGDGDILFQLGREIVLSDRMTCQLYTGHRGAGKSTELLKLKKYLEDNKFYVVYFAADDENDIDPEDTQYTELLLACTRHLLKSLKDNANPNPLLHWLRKRWESIKDLLLTEIEFDKLTIEEQISLFGKITATLRTAPNARQRMREQVESNTVSLIDTLNDFIDEAKGKLPDGCEELVVIADNLDRIVPLLDLESKRLNHDQIFIDRSEQLKKFNCHLIYTVPISLVYSERATILEDIYGAVQALPMIMVRNREDGQLYQPGIDKLKELIDKRLQTLDLGLSLPQVFADDRVLTDLCKISGGHVRNLMLLMKTAVRETDELPISERAVQRSISDFRNTYRKAIEEHEWSILAKVHLTKDKLNNVENNKLLFNRCILEYHDVEGKNIRPWHDVHPLILEIEKFQEALSRESSNETR